MRGLTDRTSGFSLIELLVALAVFALMVLALLNLGSESVRTAITLETRALAEVVADNQAVDAALLPVSALGDQVAGEEVAGERRWRWERSAQLRDGLLQVDVRVRDEAGAQVLAERQLLRAVAP